MILTISGLHGTGKSTVGKLIAKQLGISYYSTGQIFRDLAEEMNLSLEEFTEYVESNPNIDKRLDNKIIDIANKGNVIIDSQLSAYILKSIADFTILLTCPLEIRVKRIADRDNASYDEKLKETLLREKSELKRFKKLYNIDLNNSEYTRKVYNLIIDTGNLTVEEITEKILSAVKKL